MLNNNHRRGDKKKNYRYRIFLKIFLVAVGISAFIFCMVQSRKQIETYQYCEDYIMTKELPSMLGGFYYTKEEWEEKIKDADFGKLLTFGELKWILEQTGSKSYITLEESSDKEIVTREQWNLVYDQIMDLLDDKNEVRIIDLVILEKEKEHIISSEGSFRYDQDYNFIEPMTASQFYIREDEIIGIRKLQSKSASIKNAYALETDKTQLKFLFEEKTYTLTLNMEEPESITGHVCDLLWEKGTIAKVQLKEDTIQGNLIAVNESSIEIEGYGEIHRSENLPVYKTYGTIEEKELSDIVIANMKVEYVVAEDRVEAILLVEPAQISRIRVLLLGDDTGVYRQDVCLTANTAYQVIKKEQTTDQPENAPVKASDLFAQTEENSIQIKPLDENGELFLCGEDGTKLSKGYKGILELHRYSQGITLVNELLLEDYLCAVVPSEMSASYEPEALKAQAICARSYAYIQLARGDYAALGAHVDDSTNYQVYNKQDRDEKTTAAVLDTAGLVISFEGNTAEAYYYSTSAGITGNGDAWNLTESPSYGYLCSTLVKEGGGTLDLSSEEAFSQFITQPDASCYDASAPYFRWSAVCNFSEEESQEKIKGILNARKEKTPEDIVFLDSAGNEADNMEEFGTLQKINVSKRSTGGVLLQITITYEQGTVLLGNEYSIRMVLGAGCKNLTLSDGTAKENVAVMPSAYLMITPVENGDYHITGGGYGHGIGMSQNGALGMAKAGMTCEEILKFFFQNIEIISVS